jgi:hypothetical protein
MFTSDQVQTAIEIDDFLRAREEEQRYHLAQRNSEIQEAHRRANRHLVNPALNNLMQSTRTFQADPQPEVKILNRYQILKVGTK